MSLIATVDFASQASDLIVQSANNVRKPFDPHSLLLARRQEHFQGIMMTDRALGERAVETSNDSLVSVTFGAPMANGCFVISISLVTLPINLHPESTCSSWGHTKGPHL